MADAAVSFVLQRLGDYLIQEALFLGEVRNEVVSLKKDLEWMQASLKDAEERQHDDKTIRQWVSDVRDIAYDTEDVLDEFMIKIGDNNNSPNKLKVDDGAAGGGGGGGGGTSRTKSKFFASIMKCSCIFKQASNLGNKGKEVINKSKEVVKIYSIGKEIEALKKRMDDLSRRRELFGLKNIDIKMGGTSNGLDKLKQLRRVTSFAVEANVVGFEDVANKLLEKLFDKEPRRFVISIFGMGGLGKTTLAGKLYHNVDINYKFNCCAWVTVSQDYKTRDLLLRIIRSFNIGTRTDQLEKMSEEDLERYLHRYLQQCSYLVVIDDIWEKEAWGSLKRAFPDNRMGSRVIITTRNKDVAERVDERTYAHELRFLREDESWQLFRQKAFPESSTVDEGLQKLGKEMVQKCGGLPLAIIVLGGLLSIKKPQEWSVVRNHIWQHLRNDSIEISYLLTLSFNDLPYQLKLCFLYLSLFPEDSAINVGKLIRLLVAEGFVQEDENKIMEEVAMDNLDELIKRSLIQIDKICWGRIATCRVHDLLRDLAIEKAKEVKFLHIFDEMKNITPSTIVSSCRREAVYSETEESMWIQRCNPHTRSLLFFNPGYIDIAFMFRKFRLLRVLNFQGCLASFWDKSLPEEIGKLVLLKYLGLEGAYINEIPKCIGNLVALQTLHLYGNNWVPKLPNEICKLQELRHLIGNFNGPLLIDNLVKLQTLKYIEYKSWTKIYTQKLENLRELHIKDSESGREKKKFSFEPVANLRSLRLLTVLLNHHNSFSSLYPLSQCRYLIDLRLKGKIQAEALPDDMQILFPNLECLSLEGALLNDDPMPALEKLPKLTIFLLQPESYCGNKMICSATGFPRLEILKLDVEELEEWQVEDGAMPMLRGLNIPEEFKSKIPERLRSIPLPGRWDCPGIDDEESL